MVVRVIQMALPIQPFPIQRRLPHPAPKHHLLLRALTLTNSHDIPAPPQLLRHRVNIHPQILPQKNTDLGVLHIPLQTPRHPRIARVDVHVRRRVPVRAPRVLAPFGDQVAEEPGCVDGRVRDDGVDFGIRNVVDAKVFRDGGVQVGGCVAGREGGRRGGGQVARVVGREPFGGVGGIGEGGRVPAVLGVDVGVKFWLRMVC